MLTCKFTANFDVVADHQHPASNSDFFFDFALLHTFSFSIKTAKDAIDKTTRLILRIRYHLVIEEKDRTRCTSKLETILLVLIGESFHRSGVSVPTSTSSTESSTDVKSIRTTCN